MANLVLINYEAVEVDSEKINKVFQHISNAGIIIEWDFKKSQIKIKWKNKEQEEKQLEEFLSVLEEILKTPTLFMINEGCEEEKQDETSEEVTEEKTVSTLEHLPISTEIKETVMPQISNEEALKLLLQPMISVYDFTTENSEVMATKFCSEFGIRGEAFRFALALASVAPNEAEIYKLLSKALGKNSARAKLEVSAAFRRWITNSYPNFLKERADIKVTDLFNIFREDGKKF